MSTIRESVLHAQAQELLLARRYAEAVELLAEHVQRAPDGEGHALLALAHSHQERYDLAAQHFAAALEFDPGNADWQQMLQAARGNALAEVHVPVPEIYFFDKDRLLAGPRVSGGALPPPPPSPPPAFSRQLLIALGNAAGAVATVVMSGTSQLWGRLAGYRDRVWTNWYRRPLVLGILTLAYMREQLNSRNLKSTGAAPALPFSRKASPTRGRHPLPHRRRQLEQPR